MSEEAAQTNTDATAENSSGDPAATETQQADLAADAGTTDEGVTTEESTTDGTDESTDAEKLKSLPSASVADSGNSIAPSDKVID